jgi:hypothetical protein
MVLLLSLKELHFLGLVDVNKVRVQREPRGSYLTHLLLSLLEFVGLAQSLMISVEEIPTQLSCLHGHTEHAEAILSLRLGAPLAYHQVLALANSMNLSFTL